MRMEAFRFVCLVACSSIVSSSDSEGCSRERRLLSGASQNYRVAGGEFPDVLENHFAYMSQLVFNSSVDFVVTVDHSVLCLLLPTSLEFGSWAAKGKGPTVARGRCAWAKSTRERGRRAEASCHCSLSSSSRRPWRRCRPSNHSIHQTCCVEKEVSLLTNFFFPLQCRKL